MTSTRSLSRTDTTFLDSRIVILFIAYVAVLAFRITLFSKTGYTADDALIIFRYAENLAAGHGFSDPLMRDYKMAVSIGSIEGNYMIFKSVIK